MKFNNQTPKAKSVAKFLERDARMSTVLRKYAAAKSPYRLTGADAYLFYGALGLILLVEILVIVSLWPSK